MGDDLTGLDFSLEALPADLLAHTEGDILKGFGDSELDLDCLLNSDLDDDIVGHATSSIDNICRSEHSILASEKPNIPTLIDRVTDVKHEPLGAQNQSPVLESLLKSTAVSSPCVNPAPQTSNTSFAPTISGRNQCLATAAPAPQAASADNEIILAALLKRHEEDRKLLDHLVSDLQRKNSRESVAPPNPIQVPANVVQKPTRRSAPVEQPPVPTQVVVATPVSRPVGIISGTRMFVTTPATMECSSPDIAESMDVGDDDYGYDDEPCRPKTKRRSSHNAIEKRYRLSINTRIDELRALIDGPDSKLSKSAVLRRAIERIRNIERENALLRKELASIDSSYRRVNKNVAPGIKNEMKIMEESESSPEPASTSITSPASSLAGSPPLSPQDQRLSGPGAKAPRLAHLLMKHEPSNGVLYQAIGARARICLAGIFLTLFFVNPLVLWDSSSGSSQVLTPGGAYAHGGRTLLDYWSKEPDEKSYNKWFLLTSLLIPVMVIMFMVIKKKYFDMKSTHVGSSRKSEVDDKSSVKKPIDDVEFIIWRHWRQAEANISEGSWPRVVTELKSVLIALGQPFPISRTDWFLYLVNHLLCAVGFSQEPCADLKPETAALRNRALSKLSSLSFHGHLHLTFTQRMILASSLLISLRRSHMSKEDRCQTLINLSVILPILRSRLRRYAVDSLQTCESAAVPARLRWILNPEGYTFLKEYKMSSHVRDSVTVSEFDSDASRIDLSEGLMVIAYSFRRKLLEEAMELLATKDDKRLEEVLRLLTLLMDYSSHAELLETSDDNKLGSNTGMDYVQHWWSNVAAVAALWQNERWDKSRSYHPVIDSPPQDIKVISNYRYRKQEHAHPGTDKSDVTINELAQAVLLAYRVQRRCIFGPSEVPRPCSHNALKLADEAAAILESSVLSKSDKEKSHWIWCVIASDWLLTSRLSLNQPPNSLSGADEDAQVHKFERDLSVLQGALRRAGLCSPDSSRRWLVMHQARLRLWRGSHPVRTALALRRNNSPNSRSDANEEEADVSHIRQWLQQRLMRPRSGMNGLK